MRKTLKKIGALAVGGVIEYWGLAAFFFLVAVVTAAINFLFAYDSGLPYYQVGLVLVATFVGVSVGALIFIVVWQRFLQTRRANQGAAEDGAARTQQLTQSGISNNPVFAPTFNLGQIDNQSKPQQQEKITEIQELTTEAEPEIECRSTKILRLYINPNSHKLSDEEDDSIRSSIAAVTFYRSPDESPDGWIDVRAHIHILEISEGRKDEVYDAVWHNNQKSSVTFKKGDAYTLIIAACSREKIGTFASDFKTIQRGTRRRYFAPKFSTIKGKDFQVKVELIGQKQGDVKLYKVFDFRLTLEPEPKIEEIKLDELLAAAPAESRAKRDYIIERLKDLIRQHGQLPAGWIDSDHPMFGMSRAFYKESERFLAQYFDEVHVNRFKERGQGVVVLEELLLEYLNQK